MEDEIEFTEEMLLEALNESIGETKSDKGSVKEEERFSYLEDTPAPKGSDSQTKSEVDKNASPVFVHRPSLQVQDTIPIPIDDVEGLLQSYDFETKMVDIDESDSSSEEVNNRVANCVVDPKRIAIIEDLPHIKNTIESQGFQQLDSQKIDKDKINQIINERFGIDMVNDDIFNSDAFKTVASKPSKLLKKQTGGAEMGGKQVKEDLIFILNRFQEQSNKNMCKTSIKNTERFKLFSSLNNIDLGASTISPIQLDHQRTLNAFIKGSISGKVTCFAISSASKNIFLFGTHKGEILESNIAMKKNRTFRLQKTITSIDISKDEQVWAAGTVQSELLFKKPNGGWTKRKIANFNNEPILMLRFANKDKLVVATHFNVSIVSIRDMKLIYDYSETNFFSSSVKISQIAILAMQNQSSVAILNEKMIYIYSIETLPQFIANIERPSYIKEGSVPTSEFFSMHKQGTFLIIFWGRFIFLVKKQAEEMEGESDFNICYQKQMDFEIVWGTIISQKMVCLLDSDYKLYLIPLSSIFINFQVSEIQSETEIQLSRHTLILEGEGRLNMEAIKAIKTSVQVLTEGGLSKITFFKVQEIVNLYIEKGKFLQALKYCNDICIQESSYSQKERAEYQKLALNISLLYIDKFLVNGNDHDELLAANILRITIDVLINANKVEEVFTKVQPKFKEFVFWNEIEKFIKIGRLSSIPLRYLIQASLYLENVVFQEVLLNMVEQMQEAKEDAFQEILMVIKKRKFWDLYAMLSFIRPKEVLKLYLSTMMTEMDEVSQAVKEGLFMSNANELLLQDYYMEDITIDESSDTNRFFRVYWNLRRILCNEIPDQFNPELYLMYKITLEWLFEDQNTLILCKAHTQLYFEIIYEMFMNHNIISNMQLECYLQCYLKQTGVKESLAALYGDVSSYEKLTSAKIIMVLLHTKIGEHYPLEFGFLFCKISSLSMFRVLLKDKQWVLKSIKDIIKQQYDKRHFWYCYQYMAKMDLEETIIRVLKQVQLTESEVADLKQLSQDSKQ